MRVTRQLEFHEGENPKKLLNCKHSIETYAGRRKIKFHTDLRSHGTKIHTDNKVDSMLCLLACTLR